MAVENQGDGLDVIFRQLGISCHDSHDENIPRLSGALSDIFMLYRSHSS